MDIRQAILKAAEHIDRSPRDFYFLHTTVPHACGSPGCAIGWIAFFSGEKKQLHVDDALPGTLGITQDEFYDRMTKCGGGPRYGVDNWKDNSVLCAATLRRYADKYHPAEAKATTDCKLDPAFLAFRDTLKPLASVKV